MNARLEYHTGFTAAIYWEDQVLFNKYLIKLEMRTVTMDNDDHNISLERIKHIIDDLMNNAVFVHEQDRPAIRKLETAGLRVISLPEIPVDQIIGMMLFSKISAVVQRHIDITQIKISSDLGEGMIYLQDQDESLGPFELPGWWQDSEPWAQAPVSAAGKIVKLQRSRTWRDLGLNWPDQTDAPANQDHANDSDNIVVAFRKDEKE
jgi:hypothetical protein